MSKTSTKRRLNRNHIRVTTSTAGTNRTHSRQVAAVAEAKKKASLVGDTAGNTGADKLRKKTRKKLSHQQAAEARDALDAEFRDLRTTVSTY